MQARNRKFGKLVNGSVRYAPNNLLIDGVIYAEPTAEQYIAAGWKRISDHMPPSAEGGYWTATGWIEEGDLIERVYEWREIKSTEADYDAAMEEHIRQAREERGYTTREPSDYLSSSVPRWAQDAADFVKFRDAVMLVGLKVINEYVQTGVAPSLAEFRAMLPKCEWTYAED